ncbi:MAG: hypothetical protein GWP14_01230 [Actinobacteria bacterium]|nr:hypothetical protein [Actinomycetota bacterium]
MTKSQHSVLLLAIMCVWFLPSFVGCGSGPAEGDGIFSSLRNKDSGSSTGATCTITLYNISGGGEASLAQAQAILDQIKKQTSWSDLHIVPSEHVTKVCRGYFKSFSSNKAKRTLRQVRSYVGPAGNKPFRRAIFSDLPGRRERQIVAGPAQWDLRNAQGNASLCIDVYTDPNNRASAAAKQVKKLRGKGIEAWYYHGRYRSGVYVGHFNASYERVATGKTATGQPIMREKFVTHDPQFKALRKKFPSYRIDGQVLTLRFGKTEAHESSRLVPIPRFGQEVMDSEVGL